MEECFYVKKIRNLPEGSLGKSKTGKTEKPQTKNLLWWW